MYIPMLIGSLLAELITRQFGDRFVAGLSKSSVGIWISKRNTKVARIIHGAEEFEDDERIPETRLIVGLVGVSVSIVSLFIETVLSTMSRLFCIRQACCGLD
jgi:hypothetical protein